MSILWSLNAGVVELQKMCALQSILQKTGIKNTGRMKRKKNWLRGSCIE